MADVLARLRDACAQVAQRACHVHIDHRAIKAYAKELPLATAACGPAEAEELRDADRATRAAFWFTLDAINFGSGWFPTLRKREGMSGYNTIAAGLRARFERHGAWSPDQLAQISPAELAGVLDQDPEHELMALFARSLHDLGIHAAGAHGFTALIDAAEGSAAKLVDTLASWDSFTDTWHHGELELPFLKRAQIAAADLHRAGLAKFADLARLTMFADNLVPHVLRLDGILCFDSELVARIEREELLHPGSREEVEIRACAVHAVELIAAQRRDSCPAQIDERLWLRGQQPAYKARPRHRCRSTAY